MDLIRIIKSIICVCFALYNIHFENKYNITQSLLVCIILHAFSNTSAIANITVHSIPM